MFFASSIATSFALAATLSAMLNGHYGSGLALLYFAMFVEVENWVMKLLLRHWGMTKFVCGESLSGDYSGLGAGICTLVLTTNLTASVPLQ